MSATVIKTEFAPKPGQHSDTLRPDHQASVVILPVVRVDSDPEKPRRTRRRRKEPAPAPEVILIGIAIPTETFKTIDTAAQALGMSADALAKNLLLGTIDQIERKHGSLESYVNEITESGLFEIPFKA